MNRHTIVYAATLIAAFCAPETARAAFVDATCNSNGLTDCLVAANSGSGIAILATANTGNGLAAIIATNSSGAGISGQGFGEYGVQGSSDTQDGVEGGSTNGYGVQGTSQYANGVQGSSDNVNGVQGNSKASGASGVYGENDVSGGGGYGVAGRAWGTGKAIYGDNTNGSGWSGYFTGKVYAGSGYSSSDARLKKNIRPLEGAVDQLLRLHGVSFEWKEPGERGQGTQMGFIAQDFETVFPQWVSVDEKGYKAITTKGLEALLVESVRSLKSENDTLRLKATTLEDRVRALEAGRRPMLSGMGEGGLGLGLVAVAGALMFTRRKDSDLES